MTMMLKAACFYGGSQLVSDYCCVPEYEIYDLYVAQPVKFRFSACLDSRLLQYT